MFRQQLFGLSFMIFVGNLANLYMTIMFVERRGVESGGKRVQNVWFTWCNWKHGLCACKVGYVPCRIAEFSYWKGGIPNVDVRMLVFRTGIRERDGKNFTLNSRSRPFPFPHLNFHSRSHRFPFPSFPGTLSLFPVPEFCEKSPFPVIPNPEIPGKSARNSRIPVFPALNSDFPFPWEISQVNSRFPVIPVP